MRILKFEIKRFGKQLCYTASIEFNGAKEKQRLNALFMDDYMTSSESQPAGTLTVLKKGRVVRIPTPAKDVFHVSQSVDSEDEVQQAIEYFNTLLMLDGKIARWNRNCPAVLLAIT